MHDIAPFSGAGSWFSFMKACPETSANPDSSNKGRDLKENRIHPAKLGAIYLRTRFLHRPQPAIVAWAVTRACNRNCLYCRRNRPGKGELETKSALRLIDDMKKEGVIRVSFTGGEPLLRNDLPQLTERLAGHGIEVKLNTNGTFIPKRIKELHGVKLITLSLDGPRNVHDLIRGKGSFDDVIQAADAAANAGIRVNFATVLSAMNLESVPFLLNLAARYDTGVLFQPASRHILGDGTRNVLAPSPEAFQNTVYSLYSRKKQGNQRVLNSLSGLLHFMHWPEPVSMECAGGYISCRVEPNGDVLYCGRPVHGMQPVNAVSKGFKKAFQNLAPISCIHCWCAGRVELNLSFHGDRAGIFNQLKYMIR